MSGRWQILIITITTFVLSQVWRKEWFFFLRHSNGIDFFGGSRLMLMERVLLAPFFFPFIHMRYPFLFLATCRIVSPLSTKRPAHLHKACLGTSLQLFSTLDRDALQLHTLVLNPTEKGERKSQTYLSIGPPGQ